jgi:hypothetical protein
VKRDWSIARAWLYQDLRVDHGNDTREMGKGQGTLEAALDRPTEQRIRYRRMCAPKKTFGHKVIRLLANFNDTEAFV